MKLLFANNFFFLYFPSRSDTIIDTAGALTMPRRWMTLTNKNVIDKPKLTKEASTSMEDLSTYISSNSPGSVTRPKSMCMPSDVKHFQNFEQLQNENLVRFDQLQDEIKRYDRKKKKIRRNPVQRAASRLYRANIDNTNSTNNRECIGPEFVVRATLPNKQITIIDAKGHSRINVTVIMLNGQKVDVSCNPNSTTSNQLFEVS